MKKFSLPFVIVLLLSSCAINLQYVKSGMDKFQSVNPAEVKVYSTQPKEEFVRIGVISVDVIGDGQNALRALKEQAGALGAQAVINVKLTKLTSFSQRTGIKGIAVRYKK